mgnify:CR=1 FL=1
MNHFCSKGENGAESISLCCARTVRMQVPSLISQHIVDSVALISAIDIKLEMQVSSLSHQLFCESVSNILMSFSVNDLPARSSR